MFWSVCVDCSLQICSTYLSQKPFERRCQRAPLTRPSAAPPRSAARACSPRPAGDVQPVAAAAHPALERRRRSHDATRNAPRRRRACRPPTWCGEGHRAGDGDCLAPWLGQTAQPRVVGERRRDPCARGEVVRGDRLPPCRAAGPGPGRAAGGGAALRVRVYAGVDRSRVSGTTSSRSCPLGWGRCGRPS
jgi:hypothetical protein